MHKDLGAWLNQVWRNIIVSLADRMKLNASNLVDLEIGWALSKDYIVRNGDVWIGFTSKTVTAAAFAKVQSHALCAA